MDSCSISHISSLHMLSTVCLLGLYPSSHSSHTDIKATLNRCKQISIENKYKGVHKCNSYCVYFSVHLSIKYITEIYMQSEVCKNTNIY